MVLITTELTDDTCALCRVDGLIELYRPAGTRRNIAVKICPCCGLLQSIPHDTHGDGVPRPSALADYGNLRIGKGDGARRAAAFLYGFAPAPQRVLEVGPGRGEWLSFARGWWPEAKFTAVEPDSRLPELAGVEWLNGRIEDTALPDNTFDLIVMRHTLEHLPDPVIALRLLAPALRAGGYLYVEVPNTMAQLKFPDVVEELFIDKHSYHFTRQSLASTLGVGKFKILEWFNDGDPLGVVAVKDGFEGVRQSNEVACIQIAIETYKARRKRNLERLTTIVEDINRRSHVERVAVFGAGRLLDAMCRVGLELERLTIVDSYYPLDRFKEIQVYVPSILSLIPSDTILCLSRDSRGMVETVRKMELKSKVVTWRELWA